MRYFFADPHFGHTNIINFSNRPFFDVFSEQKNGTLIQTKWAIQEMNETFIKTWNELLTDDDELYCLGDLALGNVHNTIYLTSRIKVGRKILIPGNHDAVWKGRTEGRVKKYTPFYEDAGWEILHNELPNKPIYLDTLLMEDKKINVFMHHFPSILNPKYDDKFSGWRPDVAKDDILLHGHIHTAWKIRDNMINVGVDVWDYMPVSEEQLHKEIYKIMFTEKCKGL